MSAHLLRGHERVLDGLLAIGLLRYLVLKRRGPFPQLEVLAHQGLEAFCDELQEDVDLGGSYPRRSFLKSRACSERRAVSGRSLRCSSRAEECRTDPDHRASLPDRDVHVVRHSHRQLGPHFPSWPTAARTGPEVRRRPGLGRLHRPRRAPLSSDHLCECRRFPPCWRFRRGRGQGESALRLLSGRVDLGEHSDVLALSTPNRPRRSASFVDSTECTR